jgi:hypothetical protein
MKERDAKAGARPEGVGAGVDWVIVFIVLGNNDPLDSSKLLFRMMSDGLLLLSSKGGSTLMWMGLVQGLACSRHDGEETLLLSLHGTAAAWAMAAESSSFLFTVVATCYSSVERLEVMLIVIKKTVVVGVVVGGSKP